MHCIVTDYVEPDMSIEEARFREAGISFRSYQLRDASASELSECVRGADVIVTDQARISKAVLEAASRCTLVIRHGDGYDNVDLDAATRLGIAVANKPGFWSTEVAEQALALAVTMCRSIPTQARLAGERSSGPISKVDLGLLPFVRRISAATLGIIGFGKIGSRLGSMAVPLFDSVLVYDPYVARGEIEKAGADAVELTPLLCNSDVISVHVPLNERTRALLGRDAFSQMKKKPVVVNAARGGVVDTEALLIALEDGLIAGAALDTTDPEPLPANHPLNRREEVLVTPHLGWYSRQSMEAMRRSVVEDVIGLAGGRLPESVVNPEVLGTLQLRFRG